MSKSVYAIQGLVKDASKERSIRDKMSDLVQSVQKMLVGELETLEGPDGSVFTHNVWTRKDGGGGTACVLEGGKIFEKAGVNFSIVDSPAPAGMIAHMRARKRSDIAEDKNYNMFVAGVSLVFHPNNPLAPTMHANYRYFEMKDAESDKIIASWFGGGCDLTPSYLFKEDAQHFHKVIKEVCDKHNPEYYSKFKPWCDEYFRNTHRDEGRGIGGIFFDDLEDDDHHKIFDFVNDAGAALREQYIPIILKRKDMKFTENQKHWQQIRRGRYVEFNLVHDRGTKFGLATPGVKIENVLMSLPLTARWEYDDSPQVGTEEEELLKVLKTPIDWV